MTSDSTRVSREDAGAGWTGPREGFRSVGMDLIHGLRPIGFRCSTTRTCRIASNRNGASSVSTARTRSSVSSPTSVSSGREPWSCRSACRVTPTRSVSARRRRRDSVSYHAALADRVAAVRPRLQGGLYGVCIGAAATTDAALDALQAGDGPASRPTLDATRDLAAVLHTSGTTPGWPRGAARTIGRTRSGQEQQLLSRADEDRQPGRKPHENRPRGGTIRPFAAFFGPPSLLYNARFATALRKWRNW